MSTNIGEDDPTYRPESAAVQPVLDWLSHYAGRDLSDHVAERREAMSLLSDYGVSETEGDTGLQRDVSVDEALRLLENEYQQAHEIARVSGQDGDHVQKLGHALRCTRKVYRELNQKNSPAANKGAMIR
jgi:hypothetical protein